MRRRQQETTEQREHRPAQRRQRHQQETEEQEIGIRGIMIVLHCGKPRFLSLPVSPPIYRSTSAKLQFSSTARSIIIFRRTALSYLLFVFAFSKSGSRNNAESASQYTVNNNTTQYGKKKEKKRKNNVWTYTTIFAVGHPSSS